MAVRPNEKSALALAPFLAVSLSKFVDKARECAFPCTREDKKREEMPGNLLGSWK